MWDFFVGLGKFFWVLFQVIVLFNLLIVVHELGHFWAARWRGVKVEKFQIWFGKAIWKKEINGVQWGLGTIPMGGFVALPQMAPMDAIEGHTDRENLPPISPLDKIIVAFAGPLFSMLLAFFFAVLVWQLGKPSHIASTTNTVGMVDPDFPAAEVMQPGDEILRIDGVEVHGFGGMVDSITERIVFSTGEKIAMQIQRVGEDAPRDVEVGYIIKETKAYERPDHRRVGISPARPAFIGKVAERSPAADAGLQPGDEVLTANGEKLYSPFRVDQIAKAGEGEAIQLEVKRGDAVLPIALVPRKPKENGDKLGFRTGILWDGKKGATIAPGDPPMQQMLESATAMFRTIKGVTSKDSDISVSHMSSAVGIGGLYYDALSDTKNGWRWAFAISVLINVNLALLNLLPFPVLDGGHITMALYEAARKKPLNTRVLEFVQAGCVILLLGFMAYVTFFDIGDRVRRGGDSVEVVW